jgi:hypothetical protein
MRTKTILLSALLGALGSVSVHAQNVYSLNTVGYINLTIYPGFNMISCPLLGTPDSVTGLTNMIGDLFPNNSNQLAQCVVWEYSPTNTGGYITDTASTKGNANTNGWKNGGVISLVPGTAVWFQNVFSTNLYFTLVGQVTTGQNMTNALTPGFNMVSSILPMSGDLVTNTLSDFTPTPATLTNSLTGLPYTNPTNTPTSQDTIYFVNTNVAGGYQTYTYITKGGARWQTSSNGSTITQNPQVPFVGSGFWYQSVSSSTNYWLETYNPSVTNYLAE